MSPSTTSISIILEVGKKAVLHARGVAALAVATGVGAAMVKASQQLTSVADDAWKWVNRNILE